MFLDTNFYFLNYLSETDLFIVIKTEIKDKKKKQFIIKFLTKYGMLLDIFPLHKTCLEI